MFFIVDCVMLFMLVLLLLQLLFTEHHRLDLEEWRDGLISTRSMFNLFHAGYCSAYIQVRSISMSLLLFCFVLFCEINVPFNVIVIIFFFLC